MKNKTSFHNQSFHNHYGNLRKGLPNTIDRLSRHEPLVVAFLGGSITEGAGASDANITSWRALTEKYLRERLSEDQVTFINAGVGGTNSTFGAHRLQDHVLYRGAVDLLFVEFSVNDDTSDREESIRGMEGIVRQCGRLSPRTDICFLYTAADKNLSEELPFNIAIHEEVASYYDIPSINFAGPIYAQVKSGRMQWEELAPDRVHPNDTGYALYARYVRDFLEIALSLEVEYAYGGVQTKIPLDHRSYEHATMRNCNEADHSEGFHLKSIEQEPLMNWRYSSEQLYTDSHEASLTFTVVGQSAGLLMLCGPDTGIFEYSLDGLQFQSVNPFDDWCLVAYRPVITLFPFREERGSMRITVRNTGLKDERSTGNSFRILKLLSN
ncbi:SGNH/GDSL hydrolase family protein [Cohnella sp.]|uniref:SGNH/GDSL hydrolase family protein n=1 Tax=Cohnella sp. TaxID=1883426 RepID=UPI00356412A2